MGWAAAGAAGGAAVSSYFAYKGAQSAAKKISNAMRDALKFQKQVCRETKEGVKPYKELGEKSVDAYGNLLLEGPEALRLDPAYQFGQTEGLKATERGASGRGTQLSGGQQKALARFGQDYGLGYYGTRLGQLGTGVGIGQTAIAIQAGQGQGAAANVGQISMAGGGMLGSTELAKYGAVSNAFNRLGEYFQTRSAYGGGGGGGGGPSQPGGAGTGMVH